MRTNMERFIIGLVLSLTDQFSLFYQIYHFISWRPNLRFSISLNMHLHKPPYFHKVTGQIYEDWWLVYLAKSTNPSSPSAPDQPIIPTTDNLIHNQLPQYHHFFGNQKLFGYSVSKKSKYFSSDIELWSSVTKEWSSHKVTCYHKVRKF